MTQSVQDFVRDRGDLSPSKVLAEVKKSKDAVTTAPVKTTSSR